MAGKQQFEGIAPHRQNRHTGVPWTTAAMVCLVLVGCAGSIPPDTATNALSAHVVDHISVDQQGKRPSGSQTGPGMPLADNAGPDDHVRYALRHHPDLDAAFHRWRAAMERVPQARSLPDPRVSLGFAFDQVDSSAEYMGEQYRIEQMFPWFGTLALDGDRALIRARGEAQRYEAIRLQVMEQVCRAYYEYAFQYHAVGIARENLDLLIDLETVTRTMFRTGTASLADVNRAQVEISRLGDQIRSLEDLVEVAAAELNVALGRPAQAHLPAVPGRPSLQVMATLPAYTDAQWLALAREKNPELAAARYDAEQQHLGLALAKKNAYPDVAVGVEYARNGSGRIAMIDQGGSDMLAGMISINVPIWRGKYAAEVREAQALASEAHRRIESREIRLEADLKRALVTHRDSLRKLDLYGHTLLPLARQTLATSETAYRAGRAVFLDLITSQRVLLEFSLAHERAAADRAQILARVQALVGGPLGENNEMVPPTSDDITGQEPPPVL